MAIKIRRKSKSERPRSSVSWESRVVAHADVDPRELVPNPKNWRTHPDRQRSALRGALDAVGWVSAVMVNRRTGLIVDGHARVEEALAKGEEKVPVDYVDLSEEEERIVLATFDPIGSLAEADEVKLDELTDDIDEEFDGLIEDTFNVIDDDDVLDPDSSEQLHGLEYRVVVDCKDELDQAKLMADLETKGRKCRPLIS